MGDHKAVVGSHAESVLSAQKDATILQIQLAAQLVHEVKETEMGGFREDEVIGKMREVEIPKRKEKKVVKKMEPEAILQKRPGAQKSFPHPAMVKVII